MAMTRDTEINGGPTPNPTGDLIISGTQLGVGTTGNLSTFTVRSRAQFNLFGIVAKTNGSATVTGTGTSFLSELLPGDRITVTDAGQGETATVIAIASDTSLTVDLPFLVDASSQIATALPSLARFDDGNGNPRVIVNDNGNVGIGTIAPQAQVHVAGDDNDIRSPQWEGCPVNLQAHSNEGQDCLPLVLSYGTPQGSHGVGLRCEDDGAGGFPALYFDFNDASGNTYDSLRMDINGLSMLGDVVVDTLIVREDYDMEICDHYVYADASVAALTVGLPPQQWSHYGRVVWVFKIDNVNDVTIGGDQINGSSSSLVLDTQWTGFKFVYIGDGHSFDTWVATFLPAAS